VGVILFVDEVSLNLEWWETCLKNLFFGHAMLMKKSGVAGCVQPEEEDGVEIPEQVIPTLGPLRPSIVASAAAAAAANANIDPHDRVVETDKILVLAIDALRQDPHNQELGDNVANAFHQYACAIAKENP